MKRMLAAAGLVLLVAVFASSGCGGGGGGGGGEAVSSPIPATQSAYVVVAWNDLGMHCLNPSYDIAVILPPYNTVWAQVIQRGNPPKIVTSGITVEYRIDNNTTSYGKRSYGQFWDNMLALFGVTLAHDTGLNLEDPNIHNGLAGTMLSKPSGTNVTADHFQVNGIPVTPVNDSGAWSPYQVAVITAKDQAGNVLATTRATVPTSDEINCGKCHGPSTDPTVVFNDILLKHDSRETTTLSSSKPVLCAKCHGSPALGQGGRGSSGKYLSEAIHSFHANRNNIQCYDCHPGASSSCNRSVRHTSANGNCIPCHGDMSTVGGSITAGRTPWVSEPKCVTCHVGVWDIDTGTVLYRNKPGHGGVYCAGCHGSPHAMVPSNQPADNYQAMQYQNAARSLGDCGVCHATSRGGGSNFTEEHVAAGKTSACNICHTGFVNAGNLTNWPHRFEWKAR